MFLFNSFFGLFLRPLLELAITQHVAPPCDQTHWALMQNPDPPSLTISVIIFR